MDGLPFTVGTAMTQEQAKLTIAEIEEILAFDGASMIGVGLGKDLARALRASQTALRRYVEAEAEIVVNDEFATSGCRFCEAQIDDWYKHDRSFPHEPTCPVHEARAALLDQGGADA